MYLNRRQQQGFLIPVAAFIIIALGLLAAAISRNTAQTSMASTQEYISLQAFYAAESGAQAGMSLLLFSAAGDRGTADGNCAAIGGALPNNVVFPGCVISLACARAIDAADITSFYRITSAATCGGGEVSAQRSIEVSSFIRN